MTIKEIAKLAGVSIATVSKIVNGKDDNINPATRDHVLRIVKEYNYTPYSKIKNISSAKTFLLGVLLKNADASSELLNGIIETGREYGYGVVLFDSHNLEEELKHITALVRHKIDGVIWEPVNERSLQNERLFAEHGIPVVYTNTPEIPGSCHIDYERIGYLLAQKLTEYRHTRIACAGHPGDSIFNSITGGIQKCLFENHIASGPDILPESWESDCISRIFSQNITGIIVADFSSALSLAERLNRLRCHVPEDLSVVSVKNGGICQSISYPRISGIAVPLRELGRLSGLRIIEKCEKKDESTPVCPADSFYVFDHEESVSLPPALRSKKIVVIGSIHIDTTFNVDALPRSGKTTQIASSSITLGGKGANQAVGAARLGRETALIGKVGRDADSFLIIDTLKNEHVSTAGISHDKSTPTGKAYIYLEASGESAITILSGANGSLKQEDILEQEHLFQNVSYCLLSSELPLPVITQAAAAGRKYGCKNILKPAALTQLSDELLQKIDILVPNKSEAASLCPGINSIEQQAEFFFNRGAENIIITLGHQGCYLKSPETSQYFPAADFTPVDTTGGADAFIAALASFLTEGYSLETAIRIATYAAGFCISRQGVVPALVDRSTLKTHIRRFEKDLL